MPLEPLSNVAILVKTSEIMPKDIIAYAAFKARLDKKKTPLQNVLNKTDPVWKTMDQLHHCFSIWFIT